MVEGAEGVPKLGGVPSCTRKMQKPDALKYLDIIKKKFRWKKVIYDRFLGFMGDFKAKKLTINQVIREVRKLFMDDRLLLNQFNLFLPMGNRVNTKYFPQ